MTYMHIWLVLRLLRPTEGNTRYHLLAWNRHPHSIVWLQCKFFLQANDHLRSKKHLSATGMTEPFKPRTCHTCQVLLTSETQVRGCKIESAAGILNHAMHAVEIVAFGYAQIQVIYGYLGETLCKASIFCCSKWLISHLHSETRAAEIVFLKI